jgi:mannose-1-phosphate guanylyltransferase / mannose-6-phosphate isomerase
VQDSLTVFPVILCGGSGTRLWPASRPERPKQFLPLLSELSIFQDTVLRMRRLKGARDVVIVAGGGHLAEIREQLAGIGEAGFVITEPEGRDSAPAIAAAARWIESESPGAVAVVVAADHHIPDADAFCAAADVAIAAAREGSIVTFGVRPTQPATGYGYIEPGEFLSSGARRVRRFVEKPPAETARAYVEAGYLWNSGNFVFRTDRLLGELAEFAPELVARVEAACKGGDLRPDGLGLGAAFRAAPKISIDYAVMEKTRHAAVVPVDYSWSDLGSWRAIHEASARDAEDNAFRGEAAAHASRGCLVRSATGQLVTVVGLEGVGVVVEPDAVLVCALDSSQEVKGLVDKLKASGVSPGSGPATDALGSRLKDWLLASAMPLWWSLGADRARGGFRESLSQDGQPADELRRVRVPARQVYAFATAGRLGWRGPWRDAARHGLDYLEARHRRPDGLYRTLITADGEVSDDTALLYDQAFVLLALAAAAQAMPEERARLSARASELLDRIGAAYAHPAGGFREKDGRPFQANASMHLFEAAQSWTQLGGDGRWARLADQIGERCLNSFIDPATGALREVFDEAWRPASGELGRILEPGHQFEWAWLLQQWAWLTGRSEAGAAAGRLFEAGERGVDSVRGAAVDSLFDDFTVREHTARLWPQTERLKAASILGRADARKEAGGLLEAYLAVPVPGLWRDRLDPDGRFAEGPAPGSTLYHLVAAIAELNGVRIIGGPTR